MAMAETEAQAPGYYGPSLISSYIEPLLFFLRFAGGSSIDWSTPKKEAASLYALSYAARPLLVKVSEPSTARASSMMFMYKATRSSSGIFDGSKKRASNSPAVMLRAF